MISPLSLPTSGRSTGRVAARLIVSRFASVWDETCPTLSPVTSASAPVALGERLGDAEHEAPVQDDARLGRRLAHQRLLQLGERHQPELARARSSGASCASASRTFRCDAVLVYGALWKCTKDELAAAFREQPRGRPASRCRPRRARARGPTSAPAGPPGPACRSCSRIASPPCRRCRSIQSSGFSRSTRAPVRGLDARAELARELVASGTAAPCRRAARARRSSRSVRAGDEARRPRAVIASRVGASVVATLKYATPNTRPSRSATSSGGAPSGASTRMPPEQPPRARAAERRERAHQVLAQASLEARAIAPLQPELGVVHDPLHGADHSRRGAAPATARRWPPTRGAATWQCVLRAPITMRLIGCRSRGTARPCARRRGARPGRRRRCRRAARSR